LTLGLLLSGGVGAARAEAPSDREIAQQDEIDELKRQLAVVSEEISRMRVGMAVPETEAELESSHGLGPAASRVYNVGRGLSLGGYAEGVYRSEVGDADGTGDATTDMLRTVLYAGYKFTDQLIFNTELEFEHAGTGGGGSVSVELASLDYLYREELGFRIGLLLLPMGFVNEIHEPPFYLGTQRPTPERSIIPSTWRENGVGIFGEWGEGRLQYRAYVVNGFDASGFSSSGLRGGRQKGSRTKANDFAVVGRLDFEPTPGWLIGGSYYTGDSGQDQDFTQPVSGLSVRLPDTRTSIWELHSEWRHGPLFARALWTQAHLSDAGSLSTALELATNRPVASRMVGGYAELAYDLMQWISPGSEKELSPFFRYEYTDTQNDIPSGFTRDRRQPRRLFIPGIQFKPIPQVVLKLDYRNIDNWDGSAEDEVSVGFGLVF
jgi:hypothetical protein